MSESGGPIKIITPDLNINSSSNVPIQSYRDPLEEIEQMLTSLAPKPAPPPIPKLPTAERIKALSELLEIADNITKLDPRIQALLEPEENGAQNISSLLINDDPYVHVSTFIDDTEDYEDDDDDEDNGALTHDPASGPGHCQTSDIASNTDFDVDQSSHELFADVSESETGSNVSGCENSNTGNSTNTSTTSITTTLNQTALKSELLQENEKDVEDETRIIKTNNKNVSSKIPFKTTGTIALPPGAQKFPGFSMPRRPKSPKSRNFNSTYRHRQNHHPRRTLPTGNEKPPMTLYNFEYLGFDDHFQGQGQGQGQGHSASADDVLGGSNFSPKAVLSNYLFAPGLKKDRRASYTNPSGHQGQGYRHHGSFEGQPHEGTATETATGIGSNTLIYKIDKVKGKIVKVRRLFNEPKRRYTSKNSSWDAGQRSRRLFSILNRAAIMRMRPQLRSWPGSRYNNYNRYYHDVDETSYSPLWGSPHIPSGSTLHSQITVGEVTLQKCPSTLPLQPSDPRLFDPKLKVPKKLDFGVQHPPIPTTELSSAPGTGTGTGTGAGLGQDPDKTADKSLTTSPSPLGSSGDKKESQNGWGKPIEFENNGEAESDDEDFRGVPIEDVYKFCPQLFSHGLGQGQGQGNIRKSPPAWPLGYMKIQPPSYTTENHSHDHRLIAISKSEILSTKISSGSSECFLKPIIYPQVRLQSPVPVPVPTSQKSGLSGKRELYAQNNAECAAGRSQHFSHSQAANREISVGGIAKNYHSSLLGAPQPNLPPDVTSSRAKGEVPIVIKTAHELAAHLEKFASSRKVKSRGKSCKSSSENITNGQDEENLADQGHTWGQVPEQVQVYADSDSSSTEDGNNSPSREENSGNLKLCNSRRRLRRKSGRTGTGNRFGGRETTNNSQLLRSRENGNFDRSISSRAEIVRSIQEPIDFKRGSGMNMSALLSLSPVQRLKFLRRSSSILIDHSLKQQQQLVRKHNNDSNYINSSVHS